ncbi:MAG: hypothetical protein ACTSU9_13415 [Promethearchaeota archaeon]
MNKGEFPLQLLSKQLGGSIGKKLDPTGFDIIPMKSRKHATVKIHLEIEDLPEFMGSRTSFIAKYYANDELTSLQQEGWIIEVARSRGIRVPEILLVLDNFLLLSFVEGENLCDLMNNAAIEFSRKEELIEKLGAWIAGFHLSMGAAGGTGGIGQTGTSRCRGDANLRNFLVSGNAIIGVDFEESVPGNSRMDLYEVMDSLLITDPGIYSQAIQSIKWKFELCNLFLESYYSAVDREVTWVDRNLRDFIDEFMMIMGNFALRRKKMDGFLWKQTDIREMLFYELKSVFILK